MQQSRKSPLEINSTEFRRIGHELVDIIANFNESIGDGPVTSGESPDQIQSILGNSKLPEKGISPADLISRTADLLLHHSLFNGHPKFLGYITSSPAPIGALADLLASAVNPNVGANILSPVATAIEKQTIQWLSQFIGLPSGYGGILVSGGNMANFTAFLAARTAKAPEMLKEVGLRHLPAEMVIYCPQTTHTWIEKAVVLFGHGKSSLRWIPLDEHYRLDTGSLEKAIQRDLACGKQPFMVVGTAGDVSTGVVDNLYQTASVCKKYGLWFHIDGAYGIPAAALPGLGNLFDGIEEADSLALDPHKWLYAPLEVGCTLVKNPQHLINSYSSHPDYYNFSNDEERTTNFYEFGLQNSRGFRALKVWMALQQVGSKGYIEMIAEDIRLSELFYKKAVNHPELEAVTQNLSIATMRYVPQALKMNEEAKEKYLNELNEELLNEIQRQGEMFLSNAVISGRYCLRGCIVNFRTSEKDIGEMIGIIVREGRNIHQKKSAAQ